MRKRSTALLLLLLVLAGFACSCKHKPEFPLVQKYTTRPGDVFFFRPRDAQFVLVERSKALAVAIAPEPDIRAYAYDDRIMVARLEEGGGGRLLSTPLVEKTSAQQALAITPDGRFLAGGDAKGTVTLWNVATADVALHLDMAGSIRCLAFSPDGNWLAIGLASPAGEPSDTVWVYEIHANGPHRSFGRIAVPALAWSPDGRWLAAGLEDGSVLLSEGAGSEPQRIALSTSPVIALDIHPSGLFLASAHADKRVLISKLPTGETIHTFEPPLPRDPLFPRVLERVGFDGPGARLAVDYAEGEFRIWDTSALSK
jgi:WD40 repeat protein